MKIGVDAGCLGITDPQLQVGVYQVAKNLLFQLGRIDNDNEYLLYSFIPIDKQLLQSFGSRMRNVVVRPARGWMKIWLPMQIAKDKPDIFLGLSQALPKRTPFSPYKTIGLVYDIAFETYTDLYPDSYKKLHQQTKNLITHASHSITISQASKQSILQKYHIVEKKVSVVYPGVRNISTSVDSVEHRLSTDKLGITNIKNDIPYFLFVGALKRIKNVPTLIRAFGQFLQKTNKQYDLSIIGGKRWFDDEITTALQELPVDHRNHIKFPGFVDDQTLASLYAHATAFVSPSFYEGFGLPFVEAMQAGCPIIGSTAGAIPEIVGDAGILVDPLDVEGLENALDRVSAYTSLRLKMKEAGIKRAKQFTWTHFAYGVLEVINRI